MRNYLRVTLLGAALAMPPGAASQYLTAFRTAELAPIDTLTPHSVGAMALGGTFVGLGGFLLGGAIGAYLVPCGGDLCSIGPAAVGALMGETFGLALGVHVTNGHRGTLGLDWLTAAGTAGVGFAIAGAASPHHAISPTWYAVVPILQLATTIAVERGTQRADGGGDVGIVVQPLERGRSAFGLTVSF